MKNIFDKIVSRLFGWKIMEKHSFDEGIFNNKSVMVVNKRGKKGIVLRFGYSGNLQYHELFGEELVKFKAAFKEAVELLDKEK